MLTVPFVFAEGVCTMEGGVVVESLGTPISAIRICPAGRRAVRTGDVMNRILPHFDKHCHSSRDRHRHRQKVR